MQLEWGTLLPGSLWARTFVPHSFLKLLDFKLVHDLKQLILRIMSLTIHTNNRLLLKIIFTIAFTQALARDSVTRFFTSQDLCSMVASDWKILFAVWIRGSATRFFVSQDLCSIFSAKIVSFQLSSWFEMFDLEYHVSSEWSSRPFYQLILLKLQRGTLLPGSLWARTFVPCWLQIGRFYLQFE